MVCLLDLPCCRLQLPSLCAWDRCRAVCSLLRFPVSGCVCISSHVVPRLAQSKGQWSLGCQAGRCLLEHILQTAPFAPGMEAREGTEKRDIAHSLSETTPNFHHSTYSSPAFIKRTAASHAFYGLHCLVKKWISQCNFMSSLIHSLYLFIIICFKSEAAVLITLHVYGKSWELSYCFQHQAHQTWKTSGERYLGFSQQ